jgi:hypothetical protein
MKSANVSTRKILTAFCDLEYCPVSFDFVTWLVRAAAERDRLGCGGLHVVIVPKEDGVGGFARHWGEHDEQAVRWRLWHILVASCPLARATMTLAASREQAKRLIAGAVWWPEGRAHHMRPLVEAAKKGGRVPHLEATPAARDYVRRSLRGLRKPIVTLTLRRQTTHPDRNSNAEAWAKLSHWLCERGLDVVQLDDTHQALADGRGYAELDPDLRLALYEQAALNVIGCNGPAALLLCSAAPYLQVAVGLGEWRAHYAEHIGLETGDQLPWALRGQRLVYRPATFDVMREEVERYGELRR